MWVTWAFKQGRTQHRQSIVQMRWYKWVRQKLNDGIRKFPFMVVNKVNIIWHLLTNNATWSHHLSWLSNTNPRYFCSVVVSRVNSLSFDSPVLYNSVNNFWHLFPTQSTNRCSPLLTPLFSSSLQSSSLTFWQNGTLWIGRVGVSITPLLLLYIPNAVIPQSVKCWHIFT